MATVRGPLHSTGATGSIGKQLTFQRHRNGHIVRAYNAPGSVSPKSPTAAQLAVRITTKVLMQQWPNLTPQQKATWQTPAAQANISEVNAFLRYNVARLRQGKTATPTWPAIDAPPPPAITVSAWSTLPTTITTTWTESGMTKPYYAKLRRSATPPTTPTDGTVQSSKSLINAETTTQTWSVATVFSQYYWVTLHATNAGPVLATSAAHSFI